MNATFCKYAGKNDTINKTLTTVATLTIKPYNDFDDNNPYLIIAYNSAIEDCNYCIIDGVKYFIETPIKNIGNRLELRLTKDLLSTYAAELMQCNAIIDRNSVNYNSYIHDESQKMCVNKTTFSIPLGSLTFSGNSPIIISLIGGSG